MQVQSYPSRHAEALAWMHEEASAILADGHISPEEEPRALSLLRALAWRYFEAEWIETTCLAASQLWRRGPGEPIPAPWLGRRLAELATKAPAGSDPTGT